MTGIAVDLYSDTVTRPTPAMRRAIAEAEVGDEQNREDPTVNRLQEKVAELLGTENAAQIPTSFGGIVYMMTSLCLLAVVIMIEALPVTEQLRAWQRGDQLHPTPALILAGVAVVGICVTATLVPLRLSARRLALMEW